MSSSLYCIDCGNKIRAGQLAVKSDGTTPANASRRKSELQCYTGKEHEAKNRGAINGKSLKKRKSAIKDISLSQDDLPGSDVLPPKPTKNDTRQHEAIVEGNSREYEQISQKYASSPSHNDGHSAHQVSGKHRVTATDVSRHERQTRLPEFSEDTRADAVKGNSTNDIVDKDSLSCFTPTRTSTLRKSRTTITQTWPQQHFEKPETSAPSQRRKSDIDRKSFMTTMSYFKNTAQRNDAVHPAMSQHNTANAVPQSSRLAGQNTIRSVTTPIRVDHLQHKHSKYQTPPSRGYSTRSPSRQYSSRSAYEDMIENKRRYNKQMENDPQYDRPSPNLLNNSTPRHDLLRTQSDKIDYNGLLDDRSPSRSPSRTYSSYSTSNRNSTRQYNNRSPLLDLKEHQNAYVNALPRDEDHERQWSAPPPETPPATTKHNRQSDDPFNTSYEQTPRAATANHVRTEAEVSVKRFSVFNDISKSGLLAFYTDGTLKPQVPPVRKPVAAATYADIPIPPIPESSPVQEPVKGIKKATSLKNLLLRRKLSEKEPKPSKTELKKQEKEAKKAKAEEAARVQSEAIRRQAAEVEKAKEEMLLRLKAEQEKEAEAQRYISSTPNTKIKQIINFFRF